MMDTVRPVEAGDWWRVERGGMEEMEVLVVQRGDTEVCLSGGLMAQVGRVRFSSPHGTLYVVAQPLAGADGALHAPRAECTTVAWTADKLDAVRHARSAHIYVALDAGDDENELRAATPAGAALHAVRGSSAQNPYRLCAGLHGASATFVATRLEEVAGAATRLTAAPAPAPRSDVFRVGTCADYPPLTSLDGQEKFTGLSVELVEACLGKGRVQWVRTSWPDLHKGLLEGRYDAAFGGINESAKRAEAFAMSDPVLPCAKAILTGSDRAANFDRFSKVDREGVVVVTNPGGTNEAFCAANFKKATVLRAKDNKQPFVALALGEADLMITDSIEALHRENQTRDAASPLVAVGADAPLTTGHTVAIARKHCPTGAAFLDAFNKALREPRGVEALERLTRKWLGKPVARASKL